MFNNTLDESFQKQIESLKPITKGFDLITDHVIITDSHARILYANDAVTTNTGFSKEEVIGKTPGQLWGGLMPKEFYEKMWQTIKVDKKVFIADVQNQRKDKTTYWQRLHISPILDDAGEIVFFLGIEPNITKWKEAEEFNDEFNSMIGSISLQWNKKDK